MKNGQLAHELRRVGRRVRVARAWKAFLWGLAAAGALSLAALTASFFTPMPKIGRIVLIAYGACMLLFPLAAALWQGRKAIRYCDVCGNFSSAEKCAVCADESRHNGQICVVRDPRDVAAMERMHDYHGLYHVLHGTLSPMDGIGPDDIHIKELMTRLQTEPVSEVILATNPDIEGEATATYIARLIKPMGIKCTRIAHGVPVGSDLEYADEITLGRALAGRRAV